MYKTFLFFGLLSAHLTANITSLSSIPIPDYHYPLKTHKDLHRKFDTPTTKALCADSYYIGLKFPSFREQNKWFRELCQTHYSNPLGESFDCDNLAFLYKSLLSTGAFKKKTKYQTLVGVIFVQQKKEALGVGGIGLAHALNILYTSQGWYIIEPKTGKFMAYDKYPNPITQYIF